VRCELVRARGAIRSAFGKQPIGSSRMFRHWWQRASLDAAQAARWGRWDWGLIEFLVVHDFTCLIMNDRSIVGEERKNRLEQGGGQLGTSN